MNGIRYWRLKRRMTYTDLARKAGCTLDTIRRLEEHIGSNTSSALLLRIANALDVTVDELLMEYPEDAITLGDHPTGKYTMALSRLNPVGRYCREHNISLPEYAALTGKRSKQAAQRTWTKQKLKYEEILPLAEREGLTAEEFLTHYEKEDVVLSKNETKKVSETKKVNRAELYEEMFKRACALLFPPGVKPHPNSMLWADAFLLADEMMPEERCD